MRELLSALWRLFASVVSLVLFFMCMLACQRGDWNTAAMTFVGLVYTMLGRIEDACERPR